MGVFRRRYRDGRLSKDWYIDYRITGKRFKRPRWLGDGVTITA